MSSLLVANAVRTFKFLTRKNIFQISAMNSSLNVKNPSPRITIPQKMVNIINKKISRKNETLQRKRKKKTLHFKSPLVISCHRQEFNHHKGQSYSDFRPDLLVSYGWRNRKSVGDHFTLMDWHKNPSIMSKSADFNDFNLDENIVQGLSEIGIKQPTVIQAESIPNILEGHNIICAAETGSGKTLAYLLPILQLIIKNKKLYGNKNNVRSPQCVIIVPSRELAFQIMSLTKSLSNFCSVTPQLVLGNMEYGKKIILNSDMDILISTPGSIRTLLSKKRIDTKNLNHVVLDEADTLLDDSFAGEIRYLLNQFKVHISEYNDSIIGSSGTQIHLVSATMPRSLDEKLGSIIPLDSFLTVATKSLHHIMPHVKQKFLRILPSQKPEYILEIVQKNFNKKETTIVFCKNNSTSNWLSSFLNCNNVPHLLLNGTISHEERASHFKLFKKEGILLVCTDIASRGLDTINAKMVINYDFPHFVSDYIHRVGRVGRVGSSSNSQVLSLISHKYEVDIVWRIETAARKMTSIFNVNANIKRVHVHRHNK